MSIINIKAMENRTQHCDDKRNDYIPRSRHRHRKAYKASVVFGPCPNGTRIQRID